MNINHDKSNNTTYIYLPSLAGIELGTAHPEWLQANALDHSATMPALSAQLKLDNFWLLNNLTFNTLFLSLNCLLFNLLKMPSLLKIPINIEVQTNFKSRPSLSKAKLRSKYTGDPNTVLVLYSNYKRLPVQQMVHC